MSQEFRVKARTLVHLGAELIATDTIALNELIKNAFDAHSEEVRSDFDIPFNPTLARNLAEQVSAGTVPRQHAIERLKGELAEQLSKEAAAQIRAQLDDLPTDAKAFHRSLRDLADPPSTSRKQTVLPSSRHDPGAACNALSATICRHWSTGH